MEACPICLENFQVGDKARGDKDNTWWLVMVVTGVCEVACIHAMLRMRADCCKENTTWRISSRLINSCFVTPEIGSFLFEAWDANINETSFSAWGVQFQRSGVFPACTYSMWLVCSLETGRLGDAQYCSIYRNDISIFNVVSANLSISHHFAMYCVLSLLTLDTWDLVEVEPFNLSSLFGRIWI